jgi:hypothetical protein
MPDGQSALVVIVAETLQFEQERRPVLESLTHAG